MIEIIIMDKRGNYTLVAISLGFEVLATVTDVSINRNIVITKFTFLSWPLIEVYLDERFKS
jgi:hypothetical protein